MSTDDEQTRPESTDQPDKLPQFRVTGLDVVDSGRITIPSRFRRRFDLEQDDVIHVFIETADGLDITAMDLSLDPSGRIRIPSYKRDLYEIEDGDTVTITVQTTDLTAE